MKNKRILNKSAFTLVELLIVSGILAVVFTGMLKLFIYTSVQASLSGNKTMAIVAAQNLMEQVRNHTFSSIATDYASAGTPGDLFTPSGLVGQGKIYIDSSNAELLVVKVVVSWRDKYGRIIGEDLDLDGVLDAGEDTDGDSQLSSPITLISMITRR